MLWRFDRIVATFLQNENVCLHLYFGQLLNPLIYHEIAVTRTQTLIAVNALKSKSWHFGFFQQMSENERNRIDFVPMQT